MSGPFFDGVDDDAPSPADLFDTPKRCVECGHHVRALNMQIHLGASSHARDVLVYNLTRAGFVRISRWGEAAIIITVGGARFEATKLVEGGQAEEEVWADAYLVRIARGLGRRWRKDSARKTFLRVALAHREALEAATRLGSTPEEILDLLEELVGQTL